MFIIRSLRESSEDGFPGTRPKKETESINGTSIRYRSSKSGEKFIVDESLRKRLVVYILLCRVDGKGQIP